MEQLERAKKKLKTAHEKLELGYTKHTREQDEFENKLLERIRILDEKKDAAAAEYGNSDANDNDRVVINAGGKVIVARRGVLCQLKGTKFEALFSGRWEKKLLKDSSGRIFLDVNPKAIRVIVDYLNELVISGEDDVPTLPTEEGGEGNYLDCYLNLFGMIVMPDSSIITKRDENNTIHQWLDEGGVDGGLELIYRSSRDGLSTGKFHNKCDNVGPTLVLIKTISGGVFGGYTNTSWEINGGYKKANKSFLFVLSGFGEGRPCKMKLKNEDDSCAVCHGGHLGPAFGNCASEFCVTKKGEFYSIMGNTYERCPIEHVNKGPKDKDSKQKIKEMEVFAVRDCGSKSQQKSPAVGVFAKEINEAINETWATLHEMEMDVSSKEERFKEEEQFIDSFASGDEKDLVTLDVSGTIMVTKRATLQIIEESVLAQQYDDTKWTEQGCKDMRVKDWGTAEVCKWVKSIKGVQEDVSNAFETNSINGSELLALDKDGLEKIGVDRVGTICLISDEIKSLKEKVNQDAVTLIEHSPYCFGKILDHLRLKRLQSIDLTGEPAPPVVCESQQKRFEKVVKYYFPGESSKILLGSTNSVAGAASDGGARVDEAEPLRDVIIAIIRRLGTINDLGVPIGDICLDLLSQGYSATDFLEVRRVIDDLSNEGALYSTIDENHFQIAE